MAKLKNYNGSVQLMAGITQKGGGDFALIDANAVQTQEDGTRLDSELEEIRGIASLQADWNQTNDAQSDYIKNKPTVLTEDEIKQIIKDNNTPGAQVQSDWEQDDNTKSDYIKNKPNIDAMNSKITTLEDAVNEKQDILPVNTGGSSTRIWVATPNQFLGGRGGRIGIAYFTTEPILKSENSPIITNINSLTVLESQYANTYAALIRVAELYTMKGNDETQQPGAYQDYIKAVVKAGSGFYYVEFYWTYPYYFKRLNAGTNAKPKKTSTASSPFVGAITAQNYFAKWASGDINIDTSKTGNSDIPAYKTFIKNYYAYNVCGIGSAPTQPTVTFSIFNVLDNEEPFQETQVSRDPMGRVVFNEGVEEFHGVNKKQLDTVSTELTNNIDNVNTTLTSNIQSVEASLTKVNTDLTASINDVKNACAPKNQSVSIKLLASEGQQLPTGWYNIATLPKSSSSLLLHVRYGAVGGRWSSFLLSVEMTYNAGDCGGIPSIKVLNCSHRNGAIGNYYLSQSACTKARIRYDNNKSNINNNAYLDLYFNYTNALKTDGSINGSINFFAEILDNTYGLDHATGKCVLATSFEVAEVTENQWVEAVYIDALSGRVVGSIGLAYTLNDDGKSYSCTGIGTCTGTKIIIGNSYEGLPVTSIGEYAFEDCSSLTSVTIPDSVTSISCSAFYYCTNLTSVTIPDSVTSIGDRAFYYCTNLTSVTIPDSVTSIGNSVFSYCSSITSITIPDSVTSIGTSTFFHCSGLANVVIPDSITSIGSGMFNGCTSLTSIIIPNNVTSIGKTAFYNCASLTSVTIPDSITSIGENAFRKCVSLTNIEIPASVTNIDNSVFYDCALMQNYDFTACLSVPTLANIDAFNSIPETCEIRVPANLYEEWKSATNWSEYASHTTPVPVSIGRHNLSVVTEKPTEFDKNTIYFIV